ncbi:hypothetical protein IWGMT90018_58610 [Mycobacterium kiyosense]|nr:hypothetical protein IWGMT90018_58610 [Mycobacterium kiyosense]
MTGLVLLAVALLVAPGSPRGRLAAGGSGRRRLAADAGAVGWGCVGVVAVALAVLPLTTAVAGAMAAATVAVRALRRRRSRSAAAEGRALEASLEVLVGELRVGAHPVHAFDVAADESGGPVSRAMRAVAARARLGPMSRPVYAPPGRRRRCPRSGSASPCSGSLPANTAWRSAR